MNTVLTLPGRIPGLLRRGSPVVDDTGRHLVCLGVYGDYSAPCARGNWREPPNRDVGWGAHATLTPASGLRCSALALDLTDATGRAHAALWLDKVVGLDWPQGELYRLYLLAGVARCAHAMRGGRITGVRYLIWSNPEAWQDWGSGLSPERSVPALADLDPNDPRILPDGSRWVDAEALRRVVLHVAGREVSDGE